MQMRQEICSGLRGMRVVKKVIMNIEAKELSKIYGNGESRVAALDRVSLKIASGDFLSVMGPSGSGKSTLLHLLSGLDRPTSGRLLYDGRDLYSLSDQELSAFRRRRMGFIFQQFHLLPVLTAQENILMPLLLDRRKEQPDEAYLKQLIQMLGISDRMTHLPHELSGGQQQRVAIARAMIKNPKLLLCDELTGALDTKSSKQVLKFVEKMNGQFGTTVVIITHNEAIADMADRIVRLKDGRICENRENGQKIPAAELRL